jgi:hypothetical protein
VTRASVSSDSRVTTPRQSSWSTRTLIVPEVSLSAVISRACGIWNGAPAHRRVTMTWKSAGESS